MPRTGYISFFADRTKWKRMTVENARRFIKRIAQDSQLRTQLNDAPTSEALNAILTGEGLPFSDTELEFAYNGLLAQSQTAEEAALIRELKSWWDFLHIAINR
jgi:predicted ribosomally synthesized peptide with nif11-like leader